MIDNRANGGGLHEMASITCSHCHRVMPTDNRMRALLNLTPRETPELAYCRKCDHYLCDSCGKLASMTFECVTMNETIEEIRNRAAKQTDSGSRILLLNQGD